MAELSKADREALAKAAAYGVLVDGAHTFPGKTPIGEKDKL